MSCEEEGSDGQSKWPLSHDEYQRYGRQMIVPELGLEGQLKIKESSVLIVGVGGLGCPAAAYLAGAGVGTIGLVDGDDVELSNLHRQVLHSTDTVGVAKVDSALLFLRRLNPMIKYVPHRTRLTPVNAPDVFADFDIILDCTDQPASRYLISDTAVLLGKPLVSASALRTEGQLMVLNDPPLPPGQSSGGPCYRCIFPRPPAAESVSSCEESGILGPVVGLMGVYQALETIKLILSQRQSSRSPDDKNLTGSVSDSNSPTMLFFSAFSMPPFRSIRLRPRRPQCASCSAQATVTLESLRSGSVDYLEFCGVNGPVNVLPQEERVSAKDYEQVRSAGTNHLLIDVRERAQFNVCNLQGSINIPFSEFQSANANSADNSGSAGSVENIMNHSALKHSADQPLYLLCRLGNDSQLAVQMLKDTVRNYEKTYHIRDIRGGLRAWKEEVDHSWPLI